MVFCGSRELVCFFIFLSYDSNELFSCFYLCYFILFYFIYFKILINYIMWGSKSLRLNTSRLTPRLTNIKTSHLTFSPLKTLLVSGDIIDHLFLYYSIIMGLEQRFILFGRLDLCSTYRYCMCDVYCILKF